MRLVVLPLATFAALASLVGAQSSLTINTPSSLLTCIPTLITWSGGSAPYFLTANQGGSQSVILETLLSGTSQTSYTWNVNLAVGTAVTLAIRDSTGAQNFAQQVTVQSSGQTSCVGQSSTSGGATGASSTSGAASSTSRPATSTSAPASSTTMTSTSAMSTSTTAASSTSTTAAAAQTSASSNTAKNGAPAMHASGAVAKALSGAAAVAAIAAAVL